VALWYVFGFDIDKLVMNVLRNVTDVFIFTGESPINSPWMGLKRLIPGARATGDKRKENGLNKNQSMV
jgi:hypothetical protein